MSKWDKKLPEIRLMAGEKSTAEIAEAIGTTVNNLHKICHRNGIRLPRDPATYTGRPKKKKTEHEQLPEDRVVRDPFRRPYEQFRA